MSCGCKSDKHKRQKGGMVSSPAAFPQGSPWNVETALPGMNGSVADAGNFYKVNPDGGALPDPVSSTNIQGSDVKEVRVLGKNQLRKLENLGVEMVKAYKTQS